MKKFCPTLGHSFDSISAILDRLLGAMENWSCMIFGANQLEETGKLGVSNQKFWKTKPELPISLKLNESMNSYKFSTFLTRSVPLVRRILLERGLYSIFNKFLNCDSI